MPDPVYHILKQERTSLLRSYHSVNDHIVLQRFAMHEPTVITLTPDETQAFLNMLPPAWLARALVHQNAVAILETELAAHLRERNPFFGLDGQPIPLDEPQPWHYATGPGVRACGDDTSNSQSTDRRAAVTCRACLDALDAADCLTTGVCAGTCTGPLACDPDDAVPLPTVTPEDAQLCSRCYQARHQHTNMGNGDLRCSLTHPGLFRPLVPQGIIHLEEPARTALCRGEGEGETLSAVTARVTCPDCLALFHEAGMGFADAEDTDERGMREAVEELTRLRGPDGHRVGQGQDTEPEETA